MVLPSWLNLDSLSLIRMSSLIVSLSTYANETIENGARFRAPVGVRSSPIFVGGIASPNQNSRLRFHHGVLSIVFDA